MAPGSSPQVRWYSTPQTPHQPSSKRRWASPNGHVDSCGIERGSRNFLDSRVRGGESLRSGGDSHGHEGLNTVPADISPMGPMVLEIQGGVVTKRSRLKSEVTTGIQRGHDGHEGPHVCSTFNGLVEEKSTDQRM